MTANLERHVAALDADPGDQHAFERLEEAYFLAAEWEDLVRVYRRRLEDPSLEDPRERASLHYRMGQILEERCLDTDLAIEQYTEAVRLSPDYGPALRQLRKVHAGREAWDLVLQIAELEIATLREPYERAAFFAEMGHVWLRHLNDLGEAMTCFEQALGIDPAQKEALAGLARTLEAQGNPEAAAATWERLIGNVRGPDRAEPLVALASLLSGPLHQGERAVELYRRALGDDPRNENAVEALSVSAAARGQWELLTDLYERRFSLAAGARRRTAIALEAGYMQLEQLGNLEAARVWFDRAEEMSGDEPTVLAAFVDLEREHGDEERFGRVLDRLVGVMGRSTPLRYLLEAAGFHTERADDERALACLEMAERQAPDDPLVLESLCATYQSLQRHDDVAAVLERRARLSEGDPEEQVSLLIELGYVQVTQLGDIRAAQDAYERAFAVRPGRSGLAATLESLYRKTESWQPLRTLLERACEQGPEPEKAGFYCSLGELLDEHFGDEEASAKCFEASLDREANPRALQGLTRLAERSGDPDAMRRALEREAAISGDPERIGAVTRELIRRHEQSGDLSAALSWAEQLRASRPQERDGLEAVARIQERLGRLDDLTRTLSQLDDLLRGPEQAAVRRRIAALHDEQDDEDGAVRWWEAVLEVDADDREALDALRHHYRAQSRFDELAPVLRRLADGGDRELQAEVLDELARLLEERLCDLDGAIVVLWRLSDVRGRPDEVSRRIENLLERAGRFEELAQLLLERRRSLPEDHPDAIDADLRRGLLLLDPLGQFEEAAVAFRAVRQRRPDRVEATRGLEQALRSAGDAAGLARLLEEIADDADSAAERERLHLERAVLLEDELGELEQARQAYTRLCSDQTDPATAAHAAERLENLLERCGDWAALCARLESKAERTGPDERLALHERIARLHLDRLDDRDAGIAHLEAAAGIDPTRSEPWRALAALYEEAGRESDLLRAIESQLGTELAPEEERGLLARAAALCAREPATAAKACAHFERLLELEPGRADAIEFLVEHYESEGRFADVVRLLDARLDAIRAELGESSSGLQTSLRLRIAAVQADELDDEAGAIATLELALTSDGAAGPAAEPLAELYENNGRSRDLQQLCEAAAAEAPDSGEQVIWLHRLASSLRADGRDDEAAEACRRLLELHPDDVVARDSLADLYRRNGDAEPLVALLEQTLVGAPRDEEVALRMELAQLLEEQLGQAHAALAHLERVIELEGDHEVAFRHGLELARRLELHDKEVEWVEGRLERGVGAAERVELLERRADLLAGALGGPDAAVSAYREVIALDPDRSSARRAMREVLESQGHWSAVLDCLYVEAEGASAEAQAEIYERAAEIATAHIGQDAALPWLERLRAVRPDDALIVARIGDVHRMAGRYESVLRALEDELALTRDPAQQRDLQVGRARILERDMNAPGRAIAALESARELFPRDPEVLTKLEELYAATGRAREQSEVIEALLEVCETGDRLRLHLAVAELYSGPLTEPERAIPHLLRATAQTRATEGDSSEACCALLADLGSTLRATGRVEAWSRAAEEELRLRQDRIAEHPERDPDAERAVELRLALARCYDDSLANAPAALSHLRALMERAEDGRAPGLAHEELLSAESRLLELLRREGDFVELERRLGTRCQRDSVTASEWLELARLRDERLHAPAAARDAYAACLSLSPDSRPAIRGLRELGERLGDWAGVARALELERALGAGSGDEGPDHERAALSRRLGEVAWRRLHDADRAIAAYSDASVANPSDLDALRCLQQLHEMQRDPLEAVSLYEREAELLGGDDADRRREVWLRAAELCREHANDRARALRAYEAAAELAPLPAAALRAQAELYEQNGDRPRQAEAWAAWCDHEDADAGSSDHLALVRVLVELERQADAVSRCERALEIDEENADAWSQLASLHQEGGRSSEAADAWERAGELRHGPEAARHLCEAALLVETADRGRCATRLRRAIECDPAFAAGHAHLARVACVLEAWEEAETAAIRALDLAACEPQADIDEALQLATAMAGGTAARALDRLESAVLFYGVALDLEPTDLEALEAYGELLFERGDLAAARGAIEARLEQPSDSPAAQAERLAMLAAVLELSGEHDTALERFQEAVENDRDCGTAHAGVARLCEKAGREDEAVEALVSWSAACRNAGDPRSAGARLLRAAELELARDRLDDARRHLEASLESFPECARAWVLLAEMQAEADDRVGLLRTIPEALDCTAVASAPDAVARLSLLHARALEAEGQPDAACAAYAKAADHDTRSAEAALGRARLQRAAGEWQAAADGLREFCERHPEPDHRDLAEVHYKLARLLAGPLEDMDAAIGCFERAIQIAPDHAKARAPLASLLAVMPERWDQAIQQHVAILKDDPSTAASHRGLLQIARGRNAEGAVRYGLAVLRAMGIASPAERDEAPDRLPAPLCPVPELEDPIQEVARRLLQQAGEALDQVLDRPAAPEALPENRDYATLLDRQLRELGGSGLEPLSTSELSDLIGMLATLAMGDEADPKAQDSLLDAALADRLERALGRWTRRKMRRLMDGFSVDQVRAIDAERFRGALRGLAAAVAVDLCEGDLREALVACALGPDSDTVSDNDDLSHRIAASPDACELMRYVASGWRSQLERTEPKGG